MNFGVLEIEFVIFPKKLISIENIHFHLCFLKIRLEFSIKSIPILPKILGILKWMALHTFTLILLQLQSYLRNPF